MGYSLKEALKAICGVNQWSYAVFWKIGRQNPKLLIWEDCYYEVMPCSVIPSNSKSRNGRLALEQLTGFWHSHEAYTQPLPRVGEELDFLVNKMMITNQVHVVGDGLVGRTAFTGNHEWIVSGSFNGMVHPPKVLSEVHLQFSAGMQTIAVIPVLPHGVLQLGSLLPMKENFGFVQDVKTLILQQLCVPSELLSGNKFRDEPVEEFMLPFNQIKSVSLDPYVSTRSFTSDVACDSGTRVGLFQDSVLVNQTSCNLASKLKPTASSFEMYNQSMPIFQGGECQPSTIAKVNSSHDLKEQFVPSSGVQSQVHCNENQSSDRWTSAGSGIQNVNYSKKITDGFSSFIDQPVTSDELSDCFADCFPDQHTERDLYEGPNIAMSKETHQIPSVDFIPGFNKTHCGSDVPSCVTSLSGIQSSAGEDLFDALGVDFKSKILNGFICEPSKDGPPMVDQIKGKSLDLTSFTFPDCDVMSESGMFSTSGSDLLDAVVSGVQSAATQSLSENLSCRTTLTKGSISSVPSSSAIDGLHGISHQMDELFRLSRPSISSMDIEASFTKSASGKNDAINCAQTMSYSGSRVSSWVDQGPTVKLENTVATANSKKLNIAGKPMRKRLKHGENPRPRPKDRQMIQDRLKELRDMIPNGAKCSIDALLERTIKHMLFLQNVSQHADKLKQTVESKIIDKDGGLLLKDNFEGGATWAYEVDSQARMCPIIVEDLHTPHNFLVEMLCEERGFFLEIADVIRGMGLTILKGVIQKRDDKIWAHFAVEANREITRMDIFVSLVHLLENTIKSCNIPTNDDHNTFIPSTFEPTTSVRGN